MWLTVTWLHAREILDSRGNPTVEADIILQDESWNTYFGRGMTPSGASTGIHEALELRDGDKSRYLGKGVLKAVSNVNTTIVPAVVGKSFNSVEEFEKALMAIDGTVNKSNLGANAILPCGLARTIAAAQAAKKPLWKYIQEDICVWTQVSLPTPYINVINGGSHADNGLDFQEFMLIPQGFGSFAEKIRAGAEVFHILKKLLNEQGLNTGVGDEGWYAPNIASNRQALDLLLQAIAKAGYTTEQIKLGLDVASSEFFKEGKYEISWEGKSLSSEDMVQYYVDLVSDYPIISIEDGFAEDDFAGWALCEKTFKEKWLDIRTVGDDLYVTNPVRLQMGIDQNLSNSILIKLNQIGSVHETLLAIKMAQDHGMKTIISHRSGETEDTFIADLAVATNAGFIKTGSCSRTDRIAKYNQLLRIEEELRNK